MVAAAAESIGDEVGCERRACLLDAEHADFREGLAAAGIFAAAPRVGTTIPFCMGR